MNFYANERPIQFGQVSRNAINSHLVVQGNRDKFYVGRRMCIKISSSTTEARSIRLINKIL